jgi:hypothetical protein
MPKTSLSKDEVKAMLILACERIIAAEPMLSQADRDLGDGDHGMGMERGMRAAIEKLNAAEVESIEKAFSTVGMAMMSSMGGASGAIFGTFFRNGGKALNGKDTFRCRRTGRVSQSRCGWCETARWCRDWRQNLRGRDGTCREQSRRSGGSNTCPRRLPPSQRQRMLAKKPARPWWPSLVVRRHWARPASVSQTPEPAPWS